MDVYEKDLGYVASYTGKRALMLVAKLAGFKPCCLYLATFLLYKGIVGEDVWLTVMVTVICSASGIRLADTLDAALTFRKGMARRLNDKEYTDEEEKSSDGNDMPVPCGDADFPSPVHGSGTTAAKRARRITRRSAALAKGRERIRELCREAAEELKK